MCDKIFIVISVVRIFYNRGTHEGDTYSKKLNVRSVLILHNPNCFRGTLPLSSSSHMSGGSPGTAEKYLITVAFKFKVIKSN